MDATNDVIIGTASNYCWKDFQPYSISISRSGFRGRKILFVNNITDVARQTLIKLGFELIDYEKQLQNTVIERFKLLHDWLTTQNNIRYIIHCDVRDVVVQTDPSPWMEQQTAKIFGASEFILYKNEFCNPIWVEKLYGKQGTDFLSEEEVVCAGTVAGDAEKIKKLALKIYESCIDRFGDDQAALNYLIRTEFKEDTIIPKWDEGFILTAGWWLIGNVNGNPDQKIGKRSELVNFPPVLKNGVAYPHNSDRPYSIVHQYERGPAWIGEIHKHYTPDFEVASDTKTVKNDVIIMNRPLRYAADGLTIDWWDTHAKG